MRKGNRAVNSGVGTRFLQTKLDFAYWHRRKKPICDNAEDLAGLRRWVGSLCTNIGRPHSQGKKHYFYSAFCGKKGKQMKRFISFLTAMVLVLLNIVTFDLGELNLVKASAATPVKFVAETVSVDEGASTATVAISIEDNISDGFSCVEVWLGLPDGYTFKSAEAGDILLTDYAEEILTTFSTGRMNQSELGFNAITVYGEISDNGVLAYVTINLLGTETDGTVIPITVKDNSLIADGNYKECDLETVSGAVVVGDLASTTTTTTTTTKATTTTTTTRRTTTTTTTTTKKATTTTTTSNANYYVVTVYATGNGVNTLKYLLVQGQHGELGSYPSYTETYWENTAVSGSDSPVATILVPKNNVNLTIDFKSDQWGSAVTSWSNTVTSDVTLYFDGSTVSTGAATVTTTTTKKATTTTTKKVTTTTTKKVTTTTTTTVAEDAPYFSIKSVVVDGGATTATFDFYIGNNLESGFSCIEVWLGLPDGYTFKSAVAGDILLTDYADEIITTFSTGKMGTNELGFNVITGYDELTDNGVVATITVNLLGTEPAGTVIPVTIKSNSLIADDNYKEVAYNTYDGQIVVDGEITTTTKVASDDAPYFSIAPVTVEQGATTATFEFSIGNNLESGFSCIEVWLELPEGYTFKSAVAGDILLTDYAEEIITTFSTGKLKQQELGFNVITGYDELTDNGVVAVITVNLLGTEEPGTVIPVTIKDNSLIADDNYKEVAYNTYDGTITIEGGTTTSTTTKVTTTTTKKVTTTTTTTKVVSADVPYFSISPVEVEQGATTATFEFSIGNNIPSGFSCIEVWLELPEGYTFKSAVAGDILLTDYAEEIITTFSTGKLKQQELGFNVITGYDELTDNGVVAVITVNLLGTEEPGTVIPVTIKDNSLIADDNYKEVEYDTYDGTITVKGGATTSTTTKVTTTTTTTKATTTTTTTTTTKATTTTTTTTTTVAGDKPYFSIAPVTVEQGATTATFEFSIGNNIPSGFSCIEVWLELPEGYTFKSAVAGDILLTDYAEEIITTFSTGKLKQQELGFNVITGYDEITDNGVVAVITVNLLGTEEPGTVIPVTIKENSLIADDNYKEVEYDTYDGTITVEGAQTVISCVDITCTAGDLGYFFADDQTALSAGDFTVIATMSDGSTVDITADCAAADGATPYSLYWAAYESGNATFDFTVDIVYNGSDEAISAYCTAQGTTTVGGATLKVGQRGDVTLDHTVNSNDSGMIFKYVQDYSKYKLDSLFGTGTAPTMNESDNDFALFLADCDNMSGINSNDGSAVLEWYNEATMKSFMFGYSDAELSLLWADVLA